MSFDLEDSPISREGSPASSASSVSSVSITSIIIRVTTTQYQFSEPSPANALTAQPNAPITPGQGLTTISGGPIPCFEDNPPPPYSLIALPNSPWVNGSTHLLLNGITATAVPTIDVRDAEGTISGSGGAISDSEGNVIDPDTGEPLAAPPMIRSGPTLRLSYIICTKEGTPLCRFLELIESLPDRGDGEQLVVESPPWQKYITMLTWTEAEEVLRCGIVATVERDLGYPLAVEIQRW